MFYVLNKRFDNKAKYHAKNIFVDIGYNAFLAQKY